MRLTQLPWDPGWFHESWYKKKKPNPRVSLTFSLIMKLYLGKYSHHDAIYHLVMWPEDPHQSQAGVGTMLLDLQNYELNKSVFFK